MSDIVERLRFWGNSYPLHKESADEIEKLRAELDQAVGCIEDVNAERDMWRAENIKKQTACEQMGARIVAFETEIEKLRARAVKWAGIAGTLIAERDQLIGVLQIAVERSGDMETPPAWVDGACSLLNRGFLKVDRTALGEKE